MAKQNPYQPPKHPDEPEPRRKTRSSDSLDRRRWWLSWFFVFCLNLLIPSLFARFLIREHGFTGVLVGILILFVGGGLWAIKWESIGRSLLLGGGITAAFQLFPVLQFFSGLVAVSILDSMNMMTPANDNDLLGTFRSEFAATLCTLLTGGSLTVVALALGGLATYSAGVFRQNQH